MSEQRWRIEVRREEGGQPRYAVRDTHDAHGPPVAEFADEAEARQHVVRLSGGPFDWDEQTAWQDPDADPDEEPRSRWI